MFIINKNISVKTFNDFSKKYIPPINAFINNYFTEKIKNAEYPFMSEMYKDLAEYCSRDGKRVRPLILLIAYIGYKRNTGNIDEIIKLSSVLEIMHSFLLIQDDIIDKSLLRRGKKSLHILLGERLNTISHNENIGNDIALVLADILFANSIEIIIRTRIDLDVKNRFLQIFSDTYEMTAWGQILDITCSLTKRIDTDEQTPLLISTMKTAYYTVYYPFLMGYILTGKNSSTEKDKIKEFSLPLGMAFQVRDDILGVFGQEDTIGKSPDSDIIEGKMTMLVQNTIHNLKGKERKKFISLLTVKKKRKADIQYIRSMIIKSNALDITKEKHKELIAAARVKLKDFGIIDDSKSVLSGIIDLVGDV